MPGGDAPPPAAPPADGAPAAGTGDGIPAPQTPGDTPPPAESAPPSAGTPDAAPPPGDPNNPNGGEPGNDNPDGTPRRPPPPRTLREQSFAAFRAGNDMLGYKLLSAHFAVVPTAKEELAQKMAWYPGLMRPALAPRIGIAIHLVEKPLNFKGDPMPVGSTSLTAAVDQMQQAEGADRRIGGTGRVSRFARGKQGPQLDYSERAKVDQTANWPAEQQIHHYLGDLGDWFVEALQERMEAGEYGPVLKELMQQAARPVQRRDPNNPDQQPGDGTTAFAGGQAGDGAPMGPGGGRGRGRGARGGGRGPGGSAFGGSGVDIPGVGDNDNAPGDKTRRWSTKGEGKDKADLTAVKQVRPCIVWLGKVDEDERDELNKRAEALDVDILAVFSMRLHQARTGNFINNPATLRLSSFRAGKWQGLPGHVPEAITNLDVEKWRQKDVKGTDPVEAEILKMLDTLDKALKPAPLPDAVTAERAKKRIADLVATKPEEPLPVLVEARYYLAKGFMSEDEFMEAAKSLLGEDGYTKLAARAKEVE